MKLTSQLLYPFDIRGDEPEFVWFARCSSCARRSAPAWTEEDIPMEGWVSTSTRDTCPVCSE